MQDGLYAPVNEQLLRGLGVRYVLVHPDDFDPQEQAAPILAAFVARAPQPLRATSRTSRR